MPKKRKQGSLGKRISDWRLKDLVEPPMEFD